MKYTNKNILKDPHKKLREKSVEVNFPLSENDKEILDGLYDYVVASLDEELCEKFDISPAVGIAAVQIGELKRMCVVYIEDSEGNPVCDLKMINPRIISHTVEKSFIETGEGCLSIDEEYEGYTHRYKKIKVRYYDVNGEKHVIELDGFCSIAVQHEIDHLNGILYYDHINKQNPYLIVDNSSPLEN